MKYLLQLVFVVAVVIFASTADTLAGGNHGKIDLESLKVDQVAEGVFVVYGQHETPTPENYGFISNMGFIIGDDAVAVIDTGGSLKTGLHLKSVIEKITELPIKYVINTHMHPDHIFGNAAFKGSDVTFVAHSKMPAALSSRTEAYLVGYGNLLKYRDYVKGSAFDGSEIILPTLLVEEKAELDLGGRKLLLEAHKVAHTNNDLTVLDKNTGTIFLGDLLFINHIPVVDGSIRGWLKVLDKIADREFSYAVAGHGHNKKNWIENIDRQSEYLSLLVSEIREYVAAGKTIIAATREIGEKEKKRWLLYNEFHARNITSSFAELEWE